MKKTKEQMIADLYALRGGLSVISEHTDEIRKQENIIKVNEGSAANIAVLESQNDTQLKVLQGERSKYGNLIAAQKEKMTTVCLEKQREILANKEIIYNRGKLRKRTSAAKDVNTAWGVLAAIAIAMLAWAIIDFKSLNKLLFRYNFKNENADLLFTLFLFFAMVGLLIVIGIAVFGECWIQFSGIKQKRQSLLYENTKKEKEIKAEEQILNDYLAKESDIISKINKVMDQNVKANAQNKKALAVYEEKNKDCEKQIKAITEKSKLVKQALNEAYDSWLSESDWKNVDLLIYYLETSRADDLKEALQLVDKQRQTETITEAIATAGRAIQDTVQTATMRLAGAMEASFSLLSDKLSAINAKVGRFNNLVERNNELQEQYAQNVSEMGAKIVSVQEGQLAIQKELLTAEKLNGALLEKANRSSETLINDLRYGQRYWVK